MTVTRRDREWYRIETAMRLASSLAVMSTCKRLTVGCVVASPKLSEVFAVGYNGPPVGQDNGSCTGEPGSCGCVHAEANAVAKLRRSTSGATLFTTKSPCRHCAGLVVNSGAVSSVVYADEYRDTSGLGVLRDAGLSVRRLDQAVPSVIVVGERSNQVAHATDELPPSAWWRSSLCRGAFHTPTVVKKLASVGVDLSAVRSANLLPPSGTVGEWDQAAAHGTWLEALRDQPGTTWLVCGQKCWDVVCHARVEPGDVVGLPDGGRLVSLPHPSGLNRWWNDEKAAPRLRGRLRELGLVR